jgi:hypothetical protein
MARLINGDHSMGLTESVSLTVSLATAFATVYFWLVRANKERPRLRTYLTALAKVDGNGTREGSSCEITFSLHTAVVNLSVLANVVLKVRAWYRLRDGKWLEARTTFLAYDDETKRAVPFNLPPMQATFLQVEVTATDVPKPVQSESEWANPSWLPLAQKLLAEPLELRLELLGLDRRRFADVLRLESH